MSGSRSTPDQENCPVLKVGDLVRCDRAWATDLSEPAWYYVAKENDIDGGVMLKGQFRPDVELKRFQRIETGRGETNRNAQGQIIVREVIVPIDEAPGEVAAALMEWHLLGEPKP